MKQVKFAFDEVRDAGVLQMLDEYPGTKITAARRAFALLAQEMYAPPRVAEMEVLRQIVARLERIEARLSASREELVADVAEDAAEVAALLGSF